MALATGTIIGLGILAAGTAYGAKTASDAKDDAKKNQDAQLADQRKLQQDARDRASQEEMQAGETAARAASKAKAKTLPGSGKQGTILTGPLGGAPTAPGAAPATSKTILGG